MAIFGTSPEWYSSDGTLKDIDTKISEIKNKLSAILSLVYPIGSIYMSVNDVSPSTLFGGEWVRWGSGRVPVGVDPNDNDFSISENQGGNKLSQLPNHNHPMFFATYGTDFISGYVGGDASSVKLRNPDSTPGYLVTTGLFGSSPLPSKEASTGAEGDNNASNLQPYITCYMWKRTA